MTVAELIAELARRVAASPPLGAMPVVLVVDSHPTAETPSVFVAGLREAGVEPNAGPLPWSAEGAAGWRVELHGIDGQGDRA